MVTIMQSVLLATNTECCMQNELLEKRERRLQGLELRR